MALSGIIRRRNRQPLGSPEELKTQLRRTFPRTQFTLVHEISVPGLNGFNLASLLFWLFKRQYPYWEGGFEAGEFAVVFEVGTEPTIKTVRLTLHGPGTADAYLDTLCKQTGWQTKFPRF